MSLLPDSHFGHKTELNLAPLVDFLFLLLVLLTILAVTRASLYDTDVELAALKKTEKKDKILDTSHYVNVSLSKEGAFKWISEVENYRLDNIESLQKELLRHQQVGLLPKEGVKTKVLLHIDKDTPWHYVAQGIIAIKEVGFSVHPVYKPDGINHERISSDHTERPEHSAF